MLLLFLTAAFLILLILIQRGKGGGLAGAFGGMGGQSAFGTKAGDTFTRITIGAATFWIVLCVATVWLLGSPANVIDLDRGAAPEARETTPGEADPASLPAEAGPPADGSGSDPE
jgi:preprotein translocase subunit SecG